MDSHKSSSDIFTAILEYGRLIVTGLKHMSTERDIS
jgi:hypothetical protein